MGKGPKRTLKFWYFSFSIFIRCPIYCFYSIPPHPTRGHSTIILELLTAITSAHFTVYLISYFCRSLLHSTAKTCCLQIPATQLYRQYLLPDQSDWGKSGKQRKGTAYTAGLETNAIPNKKRESSYKYRSCVSSFHLRHTHIGNPEECWARVLVSIA